MPEPYIIALAALLVSALALRSGSMFVAAGLLAWDWSLCVLLAKVDGSGLTWFGLFCIDFGTALLLLLWHTAKWQLIIVGLFLGMVAAHLGYALAGPSEWANYLYLQTLSVLSWAQAVIVAFRGLSRGAEMVGYHPNGRWGLLFAGTPADRLHRAGEEA